MGNSEITNSKLLNTKSCSHIQNPGIFKNQTGLSLPDIINSYKINMYNKFSVQN